MVRNGCDIYLRGHFLALLAVDVLHHQAEGDWLRILSDFLAITLSTLDSAFLSISVLRCYLECLVCCGAVDELDYLRSWNLYSSLTIASQPQLDEHADVCGICYPELESPQAIITPCSHYFHLVCLKKWVRNIENWRFQSNLCFVL